MPNSVTSQPSVSATYSQNVGSGSVWVEAPATRESDGPMRSSVPGGCPMRAASMTTTRSGPKARSAPTQFSGADPPLTTKTS
jgi:hypothetical protein